MSQELEDGREGRGLYGVGATKSDFKRSQCVFFIEEDKRLKSIN